jgi:N6-L-threonylcarbamoyladenine synthase
MNIKTILAIETSCDETAASVYREQQGVLSNPLFSQIELQKPYGGVVPEIASRSHLEKISCITQAALDQARCSLEDIDAIAVTNSPGLPGSLLVGLCFAKGLAWTLKKPLIGINHLEAHIFSACIENLVPFPFICLTASGGHTALYLVQGFGQYTPIAQTLDDAAGEAFDKIGKLIGLAYPAGAAIEKLAAQVQFKDFFKYPRGKKDSINFSFSGLKTAVLYDLVNKGVVELTTKQKGDLSQDLQQQVASSLLVCIGDIFERKIGLALEAHPEVQAITFVGGVACNNYLRTQLKAFCKNQNKQFYCPSRCYCTDNAAMVAFVASYKAKNNQFSNIELDIFE